MDIQVGVSGFGNKHRHSSSLGDCSQLTMTLQHAVVMIQCARFCAAFRTDGPRPPWMM